MGSHRNTSVGAATMALGRLIGERSESTRFLRGADLMERGMVGALTVSPARAKGSVQGSRRTPYLVEIVSRTTGALPSTASQLSFTCTCPDWGDPCKHGVAVALELAERLDDDPELLTRFLGLRATTPAPRAPSTTPPSSPTELPTAMPTWANEVVRHAAPIDARGFLGTANGPNTSLRLTDSVLPSDRLRALGPLAVDGYDLAPDILRLFHAITSPSDAATSDSKLT